MQPLELWGGHECTVNRVGYVYFDQTYRTGHQNRIEDLDRFAALGLKTLRYPVLWERVAPNAPNRFDWSWTDARLQRIRDLGMRPIAGLLHHGGGPRYTTLVDPIFPSLFARYARKAAERYPWIDDWTPINAPLATARFSALYGYWHPHFNDETALWTALLSQVEAVQLAMREIRAVNPSARLIQTEAIGRAPTLAQHADFDSARWITWDLLTGRVDPEHPLWGRLEGFGFGDQLRSLADAPCPPDVIGVNYSARRDRFLDDLAPSASSVLEEALDKAWSRYRLPLALTESHVDDGDEHVPWVRKAWDVAERLRFRGVDVRAVTAWALLGAFDWDSLLTRPDGRYEAGAFDVSGKEPRPTNVAAELARLATQGDRWPAIAAATLQRGVQPSGFW